MSASTLSVASIAADQQGRKRKAGGPLTVVFSPLRGR